MNIFRISLLLVASTLSGAQLVAQVSVYGFYNENFDPNVPLVLGQFEAVTGEWLELDTLDFAGAVVMGSSAFDAGSECYMFAGLGFPMEGAESGFWDYNVTDNVVMGSPVFNQTINAIQHDMNNDRLLGLGMYPADSVFVDFGNGDGYWQYEYGSQLLELDEETGTTEALGNVEGVNGVILGATAFDSDNGVYALVGIDNQGNQKFIQLDGTTGEEISSVNLDIPEGYGFNELECYLEESKYIGIKRPYGNPDGSVDAPVELVLVDPLSGSLGTLLELPQIYAITPNASVFDQTSGLFVMLYYDVDFQTHVLVMDPTAPEVVADHVISGSFIELQINNREFMIAAYGLPSPVPEIAETAEDLLVWPNPVASTLHLRGQEGPVQVYNVAGNLLLDRHAASSISVNAWENGLYIVKDGKGNGATFTVQH